MAKNMDLETLGSMVENIIAGVCMFTYCRGKLTPVYLNEGLFRMLGYSRGEGMRYMEDVRKNVIPEDMGVFKQALADILKDDGPVDVEFRTVTPSGNLRWIQVRGNLYAKLGDTYSLVALVVDITEKKSVEEELKLQAERLHILSQAEGEKILDYNAKTDVMTIKDSKPHSGDKEIILTRYLERFDSTHLYPDDTLVFLTAIKTALKAPKHDVVEYRTDRFDADFTWYQANITSIMGGEGYVTRVIGRLINIHERKLRELELKVRAEKDALTGLYNKGATVQLIRNILGDEEQRDKLHALMILDLDNFKTVNDVLGHAKGDQVLCRAAKKLGGIFKGSDVVGRIGGDEFVIFMGDIGNISNIDILASRVERDLNLILPSAMGQIEISTSIGIAMYPYHGTDYDELFLKADKALYTAKANGKNSYRIYDAATTLAYHATRRNQVYCSEEGVSPDKSLEDLVIQILYEDKVMASALRSIIELMTVRYGFQKGYICMEPDGERKIPETLMYAADGYESGKETEEHYRRKVQAGEELFAIHRSYAVVHAYDEMPDQVRFYLAKEGIKAITFYPLTVNGVLKGAIVFENHVSDRRGLSSGQDEELQSILRILEAYILRIGLTDHLQDFVTHIRMLDNMDNYVYIVDRDTYQLAFINKKAAATTPEVKIGDICYKALSNRDTPCEDCVLRCLDRKNPHAHYTEERFIYCLRSWNRCSSTWLECGGRNPSCIVNCFDISDYFAGGQ